MMNTQKSLVLGIVLVAAAVLVVVTQFMGGEATPAAQAASKIVVLIGGPDSHNPAEHDHSHGISVLQTILESSPDLQEMNVRVQAYPDGWPADESILEQAATVVWYFDGLEKHPMMDAARRQRFQQLMDKGVGLVTLHQAVTLLPDDTAVPLPDWLGGARYGMFDRATETVGFVPVDHPVTRAVGPFTLYDEFYPTVRFPSDQRVVPVLPGTFHVEIEDGEPIPERAVEKTAAWAFERSNGGRGFAFTGLHYLLSLDHPQLRRLLLNAIAWTAGLEVPPTGIRSGVPEAATKVAASLGVEPTPRPEPRTPQGVVTEAVVTRSHEHQVLEQPWGVLTWFVSGPLGNSDTLTTGRVLVRPGQEAPRHYHPNCDEVLMVLQGTIQQTVNDLSVEMRVGDVISIPTGALHGSRNIGTEDAIMVLSYSSADRTTVGE